MAAIELVQRGKGETVVFVHGNASTHQTWEGVIDELQKDHRCISYDLRGHGRSNLPSKALDFSTFGQDLLRVMKKIGPGKVHLVGHSLGGLIVARFAKENPASVASLALLATPFNRSADELARVEDFLLQVSNQGIERTLSGMVGNWYRPAFKEKYPEVLAERLAQFKDMDPEVFIQSYRAYASPEAEPDLSALECPVLLMSGDQATGISAAEQSKLAAEICSVQVLLYPGLKNGILTEIPDQVGKDLRRFWHSLAH